jgi:hypothetical protein
MRSFKYILKSINLLNLLLIAAVASLVAYVLLPLLNMKVSYKPPVVKETPVVQEEKPAPVQSPPLSDYMVVAEQNVFHPERKIPPEIKAEKALPKPEIFLYGTLLTDGMRLAYIEDKKSPQSSPGRGKRQTVVKQGDVISGFMLKDVETDRIVLVRGEEQMIVYLSDAQKPRETGTSTRVAGTQPSAPGGTPARAAIASSPPSTSPTRQPTAQTLPARLGAQPSTPTAQGTQQTPAPAERQRLPRIPSAADFAR